MFLLRVEWIPSTIHTTDINVYIHRKASSDVLYYRCHTKVSSFHHDWDYIVISTPANPAITCGVMPSLSFSGKKISTWLICWRKIHKYLCMICVCFPRVVVPSNCFLIGVTLGMYHIASVMSRTIIKVVTRPFTIIVIICICYHILC